MARRGNGSSRIGSRQSYSPASARWVQRNEWSPREGTSDEIANWSPSLPLLGLLFWVSLLATAAAAAHVPSSRTASHAARAQRHKSAHAPTHQRRFAERIASRPSTRPLGPPAEPSTSTQIPAIFPTQLSKITKQTATLDSTRAVSTLRLPDARWSSLVARRAHNPKVGGSNPPRATEEKPR